MATLVVFVDSFPFEMLSRTSYLNSFPVREPITPGFGYSVNQQALLFDGKTPDDLGYFGEWSYNPSQPTMLERMLSPLSSIRNISPFVDRGIHYILDRKLDVECSNIPFDELNLFSRDGRYPLGANNDYDTIFHRRGFEIVAPDFEPLPLGEKDKKAINEAMEAISSGTERIFVSLPDLDGTAHAYGTTSVEYQKQLQAIDVRVEQLVTAFTDRHPDGSIYVLSDHGMADASKAVSLPLKETFGRSKPDQAVFFYDSLYLRIWIGDSTVGKDVKAFLESQDCGRLLTVREREKYDIARGRHGDLIFLLNEGRAFVPNYFGLQKQEAYHGYHPELDSQQGIFLTQNVNTSPPTTSFEVSQIFDQKL